MSQPSSAKKKTQQINTTKAIMKALRKMPHPVVVRFSGTTILAAGE